MQKWEYLFVSCRYHKGRPVSNQDWKPWYVNGQELRDWQKQPNISEYSNQLGAQGWELVSLMTGRNRLGDTDAYRLVFKRPSPSDSSASSTKETQD